MQIDWHLGSEHERTGNAKESEGDRCLSAGDIPSAWHAYTAAAESFRLSDYPKESVRLVHLAYGLVEEASVPWIVTALHHAGSLSALARYQTARDILMDLEVQNIPEGLQCLYFDLLAGIHLGCSDIEAALVTVARLQTLNTARAQLSFCFRNVEVRYLQGDIEQALHGIAKTELLLRSESNPDAGLAALSALSAEIFVLKESLAEAEFAQRKACMYLERSERLGPLLGARAQWIWLRHRLGLKNDWSWLGRATEWCLERDLFSTAVRVLATRGLAHDDVVIGRPLFQQSWEIADQHCLPRSASMCRYLYALQFPYSDDLDAVLQRAHKDAGISTPLRILIERQMC